MSLKESWSLEGEDILSSSLLRNVKIGHYFDIGCAKPKEISNTFFFYKLGWKGLAVDGRDLKLEWNNERPNDIFVQQLLGDGRDTTFARFPDPHLNSCDPTTINRYKSRFAQGEVCSSAVKTVQAELLWKEYFPHAVPDLVSLDVEGFELEVLQGFDLAKTRPKLFIVELKNFNFLTPLNHPVASFLYENKYTLVAKSPLDGFFIDHTSPVFDWLPKSMI